MNKDDSNYCRLNLIKYIKYPFQSLIYKLRPVFVLALSPVFRMMDNRLDFVKEYILNAVIVSLPSYSMISKISLDDLPYERLIFKLKDEFNTVEI